MKSRGSIQVIEMSFVLPVAMLIVLSLVYLAFAMFMLQHTRNLAHITANELSTKVGVGELYWQILGNYIDDESLNKIEGNLKKSLDDCAIIPGVKFDSNCSVNGKLRQPTVHVNIGICYFGKEIYRVEVDKDVYKPKEFADTVDFGHVMEKDFTRLKKIYDSFF